jgi:hypothetical protein
MFAKSLHRLPRKHYLYVTMEMKYNAAWQSTDGHWTWNNNKIHPTMKASSKKESAIHVWVHAVIIIKTPPTQISFKETVFLN